MNVETLDACLAIAKDVSLNADMKVRQTSYDEQYGEICRREAADEIALRIQKLIESAR